jgi:hypothetical protein
MSGEISKKFERMFGFSTIEILYFMQIPQKDLYNIVA